MYKRLFAACGVACLATTTQSAVTFDYHKGDSSYEGPAPTWDFETEAPITGGLRASGSLSGIRAQPFGGTGYYYTVSPADGASALLDLSSFGEIGAMSFLWGSIDSYNSIEFLDSAGGLLGRFTGTDIYARANGDQTSPFTNPLVTFNFTDETQAALDAVRFVSTGNAFEFDNIAIAPAAAAVPEPASWAMMLIGFGAIGHSLRAGRHRRPLTPV